MANSGVLSTPGSQVVVSFPMEENRSLREIGDLEYGVVNVEISLKAPCHSRSLWKVVGYPLPPLLNLKSAFIFLIWTGFFSFLFDSRCMLYL